MLEDAQPPVCVLGVIAEDFGLKRKISEGFFGCCYSLFPLIIYPNKILLSVFIVFKDSDFIGVTFELLLLCISVEYISIIDVFALNVGNISIV